jgi:hypothetical protein
LNLGQIKGFYRPTVREWYGEACHGSGRFASVRKENPDLGR